MNMKLTLLVLLGILGLVNPAIAGDKPSAQEITSFQNLMKDCAKDRAALQVCQEALQGALSNKTAEFKTWKTIKLGTGFKTADDFHHAVKAAGNKISDWGNDILGQPAFTASTKHTTIDLVVMSNAQLGFEDGATVQETYDRAKTLGLKLCPAEVGPQLRMQYADQPMDEWLLIAMEPVAVSYGILSVFYVGRNDGGQWNGQWLNANRGHPDNHWDGDARWVFCRKPRT